MKSSYSNYLILVVWNTCFKAWSDSSTNLKQSCPVLAQTYRHYCSGDLATLSPSLVLLNSIYLSLILTCINGWLIKPKCNSWYQLVITKWLHGEMELKYKKHFFLSLLIPSVLHEFGMKTTFPPERYLWLNEKRIPLILQKVRLNIKESYNKETSIYVYQINSIDVILP